MKNEIKLIICDMDGTLLHDFDKKISDDLPYVISELNKRGVRFVCASGRQKSSVEEKIKNVDSPVICFGDNAGVLYLDGEMISVFEVDKKVLEKTCEIVRKEPDFFVTATMADGMAYYEDTDERVVSHMKEFFVDYKYIDDVTKAEGKLIKISFLDFKDPSGRGLSALRDSAEGYTLMTTGGPWIDIVRKEVSKGYGLKKIVEKLGLTLDNVMAFGDGGNDISMLSIAKYSFAMANADDEVKKICKCSCLSADEDGVTKKIKEVFEIA